MPAFLSAKAYILMTGVLGKYQDSIKMLHNTGKTNSTSTSHSRDDLKGCPCAPALTRPVPSEGPVHTHGVG